MKIDVSRSTARMLMRAMKKGFNGLDGETPEDYNQAIRVLFRLAYYNDNVFLTTSEVEKLQDERDKWELENLYEEVPA